jgi:hypothetical protein
MLGIGVHYLLFSSKSSLCIQMGSLEYKPSCQLELSSGVCGTVDGAKQRPTVKVAEGLPQDNIVKQIERLGAEFNVTPLANWE